MGKNYFYHFSFFIFDNVWVEFCFKLGKKDGLSSRKK
ncbi:MAG: hypothetical protein ACD_28C00334G0003 [uncultured bacterium]|nr:MAG: hypothetical protein ACD_28C00334G0003 [uncultured bacterium]